jgi:hypothetical protein
MVNNDKVQVSVVSISAGEGKRVVVPVLVLVAVENCCCIGCGRHANRIYGHPSKLQYSCKDI